MRAAKRMDKRLLAFDVYTLIHAIAILWLGPNKPIAY